MESWLSVPIIYLLLLYSHLTTADSPSIKEDDLSIPSSSHYAEFSNQMSDPKDFVRLLLMAAQNNYRSPIQQFRGHNVGIPFRPVRRIGSEFLGKRSDPSSFEDDHEVMDKRARMGSEFLGKRRMGSEFLGKRRMGSEFLGKRRMGSEFLGKRRMGSEFLGKRRMGSEFLGKRRIGSEFLGKREYDSSGSYESDRLELPQVFLHNPQIPIHSLNGLIGKRALGSGFLGKRKPSLFDYSFKRGRLGSEFLGKRSAEPEEPTYMQSERDSETEEKGDENVTTEN